MWTIQTTDGYEWFTEYDTYNEQEAQNLFQTFKRDIIDGTSAAVGVRICKSEVIQTFNHPV